jgi:hypothetical protein
MGGRAICGHRPHGQLTPPATDRSAIDSAAQMHRDRPPRTRLEHAGRTDKADGGNSTVDTRRLPIGSSCDGEFTYPLTLSPPGASVHTNWKGPMVDVPTLRSMKTGGSRNRSSVRRAATVRCKSMRQLSS